MSWLMLEGYKQKKYTELLNGSGIPNHILSISKPRRLSGISFPAECREQTFSILGIDSLPAEVWQEKNTNQAGVKLLDKKKGARKTPLASPPKTNISKDDAKQRYVKECSKRFSKVIQEKQLSLNGLKEKIQTLTEQLVETNNTLEIQQAELAGLVAGDNSFNKKFEQEFDNLKANPFVEKVEVANGVVKVFTTDMIVNYRQQKYNFGKFRIEMHSKGYLKVYPLSRKYIVNRCVHPHVRVYGDCCLGNISKEVAKLLARYEFAILAQLIISFLQSYSGENPYQSIEGWIPEGGRKEENEDNDF